MLNSAGYNAGLYNGGGMVIVALTAPAMTGSTVTVTATNLTEAHAVTLYARIVGAVEFTAYHMALIDGDLEQGVWAVELSPGEWEMYAEADDGVTTVMSETVYHSIPWEADPYPGIAAFSGAGFSGAGVSGGEIETEVAYADTLTIQLTESIIIEKAKIITYTENFDITLTETIDIEGSLPIIYTVHDTLDITLDDAVFITEPVEVELTYADTLDIKLDDTTVVSTPPVITYTDTLTVALNEVIAYITPLYVTFVDSLSVALDVVSTTIQGIKMFSRITKLRGRMKLTTELKGKAIYRTELKGGLHMAATNQLVKMDQGDYHEIEITVFDENDKKQDITGTTEIRWAMLQNPASIEKLIYKTLSGGGIVLSNSLSGKFKVILLPADTVNLSGGFYHEAEVTDVLGRPVTVTRGDVEIEPVALKPEV